MNPILLITFCFYQQASIIQSLTAFRETQQQEEQLVSSSPMYQNELLSSEGTGDDIPQLLEGNQRQHDEQELHQVNPGKFIREKSSHPLFLLPPSRSFSNNDLHNYPLKPTVYQYVRSCCNREVMRPMGGGHMTGPCCAQLIRFNYFIRLSYKWFKEVMKQTNKT
ncbi:unnamed protein product [Trichobilharzia regenti]|uniref:Uncharacterized protein n=1 Tax=Trichobilharzia regenti TaxID=157069 RepID=A0A183WQQ9_TRIRE|nr:unnamed protein product [Trichobilharzia regenti]VDQ10340.1 unnamed protein product [Trichobilharzia regenti]